MEAIIIAIIIGIITSIFNKGKTETEKKPSKQMPPFSNQPAPRQQKEVRPAQQQNRPKTLEDFANEVFGQLNEKAKPVEQKVETVPPIQVEKPIQRQMQPVVEQTSYSQSTNSNRVLTERPIVQKLKQQSDSLQVVPSNKRELMQAIVMSEILGPPKAKRK